MSSTLSHWPRARHVFGAALFILFGMIGLAGPLSAQQEGLFRTVVKVNDLAITQYEINQRILFLQLLRAPGSAPEEARDGLIDDRLRLSATRSAGIQLTDEEILEGMEEFAGRANLTAEQFIAALGQRGVEEQTFRDFVEAGLAWRNFVQARFGPQARVNDTEIDRALALQTGASGVRVLLSEIILPLAPQVEAKNRALIQRLSDTITTEAAFAAAARRYSAAPTRTRGGRLEWLPLGNVPPPLRGPVLTLGPGEVTDPIDLGPGIGIFQLRAIEETEAAEPDTLALEYVTLLIPGGTSEAARATAAKYDAEYDTCDDLYRPAQKLPPDYFDRVVLPAAEVPGDIAVELMKLDNNEVSTAITRQDGAFLVYLMLCGRTLDLGLDDAVTEAPAEAPADTGDEEAEVAEAEADAEAAEASEDAADEDTPTLAAVDARTRVRDQLFNQRLASYAESYLEELRADALIIVSE